MDRGSLGQFVQLRVGIAVAGPHGALDPTSQVVGVEQRAVERARLQCLALHPLDVRALVAAPEEPALAPGEHLGMGVEHPHHPRCPGLRLADDEEDGRRRLGRRPDAGQLGARAMERRLLALDRASQRSDPLLAPTELLGRLRQLGSRRVALGLDRFDLAGAAAAPPDRTPAAPRGQTAPPIGLLAYVESWAPSSSPDLDAASSPANDFAPGRAHQQPLRHDSQCFDGPLIGPQRRFPWNDRFRGTAGWLCFALVAVHPDAVQVRDLTKTFRVPIPTSDGVRGRLARSFARSSRREMRALDGVSFDVRKGEFFGIAGRNGSGKSTLLKLVAGIHAADGGAIKVAGRVGPFLELGVGFNPELSARENIVINGVMLGRTPEEMMDRLDSVMEFADLGDFAEAKLKHFSSGMRLRLGFSVMVQADPDVYLFDEVMSVG